MPPNNNKLDYDCRVKQGVKSFSTTSKLLMGPGPCNVSERVSMALMQPILCPLVPENNKVMDDTREMLKHVFQTKNPLTFLQQTSGTGGIETAIVNLTDPGDAVLVASGGSWGERTAIMCERHGNKTHKLRSKPGEVFTFEELETAIVKYKPVALFITHGESSGGTLQPLEGLSEICHRYDCLLVVDVVVSLGCVPVFVDRWGIDVAISASQKAIGAPPGMALMTFSPRAHKRILETKTKPSFYYDVLGVADAWKCFEDRPRIYHYTINSSLVCGLREALAQICEEGLENVWRRHEICARRLWKGLEGIGIKLFVEKGENRFFGVTPIVLPQNVRWQSIMKYLSDVHMMEVGFGIGPTLNKALRVGVLNLNARPAIIDHVLECLEDALEKCGGSQNYANGTENDIKITC